MGRRRAVEPHDAPRLLQARRAYVFVHPALPPYAPPTPHPVWLSEFLFETTRAIARLIYSGTFERCPDARCGPCST